MISVREAIERIVAAFEPMATEFVPIANGYGRILSENAIARMNQPPFAVSAMDGYAVRSNDALTAGTVLTVIGTAPAGKPFSGYVESGNCVRIFTGGVVPDGTDSVVIQENVERLNGNQIRLDVAAKPSHNIRRAGLDFKLGEVLATAGRRLTARDLALIAAGDIPELQVYRRPCVAIAATGDELTPPGGQKNKGEIVASSGYALAAMIETWGGSANYLGIVPDSEDAISALPDRARDADLLVTLGGASVGDHDLIQKALLARGLQIDFWKIAMRPGKPLLFGRIGATPLLGLPGNPVSSIVCAALFLKPAIEAMLGEKHHTVHHYARIATPLAANDSRHDFLRATIKYHNDEVFVTPMPIQDSSMLLNLARADVLIMRPPHAPAAPAGSLVEILSLNDV
jgi:molybdopterin molybdotransferase